MSNTRIWDALKTTDPKYTKAVTFGQKFTSINAQWQIQRMTEQFGPVGQGWGYDVQHSIERLRDDYVLAVADVTIWWRGEDAHKVAHFGPVRGMCPLIEKGKSGVREDDDAGKKAMTDALTKGLSHLGLSADVFLGLFDDNKYVQRVTQQFANGAPFTGDTLGQARQEAIDTGMTNGETRSTYQIKHAEKSAGRLAAELWASNVLEALKSPGFDTLAFKDWKLQPCTNKGTKTNAHRLDEMREKHPDLADKIDEAADALPLAAA